MSARDQLTAVGDGVDSITRAAISVMLDSVASGKVNFGGVFPKRQKIWRKIPLVINDPPLDVQCRTLLNMTNGNRKAAVEYVVEGRFAASVQPEQEESGPANISGFVDKFYSSDGLSVAGYVTKHVLNFVLPGNIGSQAEAVAYFLDSTSENFVKSWIIGFAIDHAMNGFVVRDYRRKDRENEY